MKVPIVTTDTTVKTDQRMFSLNQIPSIEG